MKLKILTFNWHEPYLCLLARVGHEFWVVEPEISPGRFRRWDVNMRPVPENVRLASFHQARRQLDQGAFDLVIAHNVKDLVQVRDYSLPKIITFHNRLTTEIALTGEPIDRRDYLEKVEALAANVKKVFISESKKNDWGLPGEVILPGIDASQYGGYTGERQCLLRVGNLLRERDLMMGFSTGEQLRGDHPVVTMGLNPAVADSRMSAGFDDLLHQYRTCRLYLNTTTDEFEDGYNLAMLEAMATGIPVVSTYNRTSPISDGLDGFISRDLDYLKNCVATLLQDPEMARKIGERGRQTVREKFGLPAFLEGWSRVIRETIVEFLQATGIALDADPRPFHEKPRKNILMRYVSYPTTTAFYLERALRKHHNVITCGPMISPDVIRRWNLENLKRQPEPQDIPCDGKAPLTRVLEQLPTGWAPDFFLWVETGLDGPPPDLAEHRFPKTCYLIDTHLQLERHKEIAARFDFVFLAQKAYVEEMKAGGNANVFWLPLACDPEFHGKQEVEKRCDVGFVGTVSEGHRRRTRLLQAIGENFHLHRDRKFLDEMARLYAESRIVFNEAVHHDLNMRLFEALCSGSLLVTDRAKNSGLEDFFEDGKHLVLYEDASLVDTVRHYLNHPEERERIAEMGRQEVLAKHTYGHRADSMILQMNQAMRNRVVAADGKPDSYYENVRTELLPLIPEAAKSVLEVGCGAGRTGAEIKKRSGAFVAGIELNSNAAAAARELLDDVLVGDVEAMQLPYDENSFDCILFADVLEHLVDPGAALNKVKRCLKPGGVVVASIPNVQYFGVVHQLVEGRWTYEKEGILDETHLRFFTYREIEKLFSASGFDITLVEEVLDPAYHKLENRAATRLKLGRMTIENLSAEELRRFFVFQYKIQARARVAIENPLPPATAQPPQDQVHFELGLSCQAKGMIPQAMDHFVQTLQHNIENRSAMTHLLIVSNQENRFEEVENILKRYLALHPANLGRLADLATIQFKTGRKEELRETVELILLFDPGHKEGNRFRKLLDSDPIEVH